MKSTHTFCRICEPNCPLVAELNDQGKVVKLIPDLNHVSGGIACHKGLSFTEIHNDPDRVNWPQKRLNPRSEEKGNFVRVDWDSSLAGIGKKLKSLSEEYGPDPIAFYHGNPIGVAALASRYGPRACASAVGAMPSLTDRATLRRYQR